MLLNNGLRRTTLYCPFSLFRLFKTLFRCTLFILILFGIFIWGWVWLRFLRRTLFFIISPLLFRLWLIFIWLCWRAFSLCSWGWWLILWNIRVISGAELIWIIITELLHILATESSILPTTWLSVSGSSIVTSTRSGPLTLILICGRSSALELFSGLPGKFSFLL